MGQISESYRISPNHLLKVVQKLSQLGYVETTRGKSGGVRLLADPSSLTLGAIVRGMEPELGVGRVLARRRATLRDCSGVQAQVDLDRSHDSVPGYARRADIADITVGKPRVVRLLQLAAR